MVRAQAPAPIASTARARFEVYRVNDEVDRFAVPREAVFNTSPKGEVLEENTSWDPKLTTHYARFAYGEGETKPAAITRVRAVLNRVPIPADMRFALQEVESAPAGAGVSRKALRTYVIEGEPVLTTEDIIDATALPKDSESPAVAITLSTEGALRFADVTSRWVHRRLAILIDGEVQTAPVVRMPITGPRTIISLASDDPVRGFAEAQDLAHRLKP